MLLNKGRHESKGLLPMVDFSPEKSVHAKVLVVHDLLDQLFLSVPLSIVNSSLLFIEVLDLSSCVLRGGVLGVAHTSDVTLRWRFLHARRVFVSIG